MPTHQQIRERDEIEKQGYREKLKFFSLVLVIIVVSYILLKVLAYPFSSGSA